MLFLLFLLFSAHAATDCGPIKKKQQCKKTDGCKYSNKQKMCIADEGAIDIQAEMADVKNMVAQILARDARKDVIVFGGTQHWPPFCYSKYEIDPITQNAELKPVGFLYDVAKWLCKNEGLNCQFHIMGAIKEDCWTPEQQIGSALQSGMFDMCLCYTVTPGRLARSLWPTNENKGWTKQAEGGLLTLSEYEKSGKMDPFSGQQTMWDWLKMDWTDGCNGETMKQREDGVWVDDCVTENGYEVCRKTCHQGKIRIGLIQGWALTPQSFDWVKNMYTGGRRNPHPDRTRVIWVDEHIDESNNKVPVETYNHLAKALTDKTVHMAYTYANLLDAMHDEDCVTCNDSNVWRSKKLKFHQKGMWFSAGGASGFFTKGDSALRDLVDRSAQKLLDDKAEYCPMCIKYWPTKNGCESHCIGCGTDGTNECANL